MRGGGTQAQRQRVEKLYQRVKQLEQDLALVAGPPPPAAAAPAGISAAARPAGPGAAAGPAAGALVPPPGSDLYGDKLLRRSATLPLRIPLLYVCFYPSLYPSPLCVFLSLSSYLSSMSASIPLCIPHLYMRFYPSLLCALSLSASLASMESTG